MKSHEHWSVFGREQPAAHVSPDLEPLGQGPARARCITAAIYATDVEG
jgi:hypothetical protein